MLGRWEASGLLAATTPVSGPDDVLAVPEQSLEAIAYNLALRLRALYGATLEPDIAAAAEGSVKGLWRDRLAPADGDRTVGSIILRALRLLANGGGFPDSFTLTGAIMALNAMMRRWEANGIPVGWSDVAAVADDVPAPTEADEAIVYNLAVRLSSEYGQSVTPAIAAQARDGYTAVIRDVYTAMPPILMVDQPRPQNWSGSGYNIQTGSYWP